MSGGGLYVWIGDVTCSTCSRSVEVRIDVTEPKADPVLRARVLDSEDGHKFDTTISARLGLSFELRRLTCPDQRKGKRK